MHLIFLAVYLTVVAAVGAAEFALPSSRLPAAGTWQAAGVGTSIPATISGLTIYTTINSTGDTTDRRADIQAAMDAAPEGQAIKLGAGVFRISSGVGFGYQKPNRFLIGTTDATGTPLTILEPTGGTVGVQLGTSFSFTSVTTGVPASFTKGATTLEVADSSGIMVNRLMRIRIPNEAATPVHSIYNYDPLRGQLVYVTGKPDSTHVTIEAPGLHMDLSHASSITLYQEPNNFISRGNGVANIIIDVTTHASYGSYLNYTGIAIETSYGSWIYNCKVMRSGNYGFAIYNSFRCQMERVWAQGEDNGSSTAGIFVNDTTSSRFTDYVIRDQPFGVLFEYANSGNVFTYGVLRPGDPVRNPIGLVSFNVNHAPWAQANLVEGNDMPLGLNDGYFGGTGFTWWYRNRIIFALALKRWSRNENSVGNIHGTTGQAGGGYSLGDPYLSNSGSNGTASMRGALSTLTTRDSDTAGTITGPSGHGVTTGSTISVYWSQVVGGYNVSKIRRDVTVGTVSGTSIPISGGAGDVLPSASAQVYVQTSNSAVWDYGIDWNSATGKMKEWPGTLTTRTDDYSGQVTLNAGLGASLQASITAGYGGDVTRGLWEGTVGSGGLINFVNVTNITGDVVTFTGNSYNRVLPAVSTPMTFVPSPQNAPEKDMDVVLTLYSKANYFGAVSGSGIPSHESIGADTLPASLVDGSTPETFSAYGKAWPPYDPTSPNETHLALPAGEAYDAGWWTSDPNTVATPQFSPSAGTHAAGTTLTITCATTGHSTYYTLDNSTPTPSSTLYSGPISLSVGTTVVKARSFKSGMTDSAVQSGTYTLVTAPNAPSGLGATATSSSQINITWTDNSSTETGFRIERRVGAGSWNTVTTTAANATSYSNTGLTASTTYDYRVFALNVAGDSAASNTASATTQSEGGGGGGGAANATVNQLTIQTLVIP